MTRRSPFDDVTDLFDQLGEELDEVGSSLEGASAPTCGWTCSNATGRTWSAPTSPGSTPTTSS
ncbi:hypothetical protein ACFQRB_06215 [Halobaculum litoreum]|uniref:Uncharacterized protein n=1 Tax=Halobaculum litoreum TaxID=3031998 RepID=A0ABD5XRW0_9EURY